MIGRQTIQGVPKKMTPNFETALIRFYSMDTNVIYIIIYSKHFYITMRVQFYQKLRDIAFKLNASIFQFAQTLDYWQTTTTNASFKCQVFKYLLINADLFKTIILK